MLKPVKDLKCTKGSLYIFMFVCSPGFSLKRKKPDTALPSQRIQFYQVATELDPNAGKRLAEIKRKVSTSNRTCFDQVFATYVSILSNDDHPDN